MKKRNLFLLLLSLVCVVCMAFGFAACDKDDPKPQYTITFSLGEYTGTESAPASVKKEAGSKITLPEVGVTWEDHSFLGWTEGASGAILEAGSSYTVTKDATLTAQWQNDFDDTKFIVNYMVNDVNISRFGGPYVEGDVGDAIGTLPTETEIASWAPATYDEFKGWSTVEGDESAIIDATWQPAAGLNFLYAIFTGVPKEAPTLTFYASEEDTANPITITAEFKKPADWADEAWCFTIPECTFTNGDFEFICWYYRGFTPLGTEDRELMGIDGEYTGIAVFDDLEFASGYENKFYAMWKDPAEDTLFTVNYMVEDVNISRFGGPYTEGNVGDAIGTLPTEEDIANWAPANYGEFKGWSTVEGDESAIIDATWQPEAGLNFLYAIFTGVTNEAPTLTFYASEEDTTNPITITAEWKTPEGMQSEMWCFTIPACTFTNGDKEFICWYYYADTLYGTKDIELMGIDGEYTGLAVLDDLDFAAGYEYKFYAKWQDNTPTLPSAGGIYTGSVTINSTMGGSSITIVWMKVESLDESEAVFLYKLAGNSAELTVTADGTTSEAGNGYYAKFGNVTAPKAFILITEDELIFTTSDDSGTLIGTLTKGGSVDPDPDTPNPDTYTVSYALASRDDFAGDVTGTLPPSITAKAGDTITVPTVDWTKSGYHIERWIVQWDNDGLWTTESSVSNQLQSGDTFTMPAKNIRIAPVWVVGGPTVAETYNVSYALASRDDLAGNVTGTLPPSITAKTGDTITVPTVDWTMSGYYISRWIVQYYVDAGEDSYWATENSISTQLQSGDTFTMPAKDIRIAPVWTKGTPVTTITIIYDSNGGSGTMANGTVQSDKSLWAPQECTFDAPTPQQRLLGWSLTADASSKIIDGAVPNATWTAYVKDNTITLYAIWSPAPSGNSAQLSDILGKWTTELVSGNHTITIIEKSGEYGLVGFAVLDGNTFITIFDEAGILNGSNTDNDYVTNYTFEYSDGTFTLKEVGGNTYNFTKKESVPTASEDAFLGKWTRSATQKVLIEANGVAYYSYQGVQEINWLLVGEYLVFAYADANSYAYYYILTKTDGALTGFFLAPDKSEVATSFTANGFYVLKVDGKVAQFVNEGSKPAAIAEPTAPNGKKFAGWVLADSDTPFSFDENMTADASIVAKFVDSTAPSNILVFTGSWYGVSQIEINLDTNEFIFTVNGVRESAVIATIVEAGVSWSIMGINNPAGSQRWFKIDGDQLKIYDSSWMDPEDLDATFTKA